MPRFGEDLLQFIWQHRLLKPGKLITVSGREITVLTPGELNTDAGPDFFNARLMLDDLVLAGNVEVHLKTSDWLKHGHQDNKNYDIIILHVVYEHDRELEQNERHNVEVLELKHWIPEKTVEMYETLDTSRDKLPCHSLLGQVDDSRFVAWMERMAVERLQEKVNRIEEIFKWCERDYTQTFYSLLLRNFGFKVNALPFELVARYLPVKLLLRHADNLLQVEALLLGIAGMLEEQYEDTYIRQLQNEFAFLKAKYKLTCLKKEIFKFSRLRPANFPNVRLTQFAALFHGQTRLFSHPDRFFGYDAIISVLKTVQEGYWQYHYKMDGRKTGRRIGFGESSAESLIINTFAPFFFFYAKKTGRPGFEEAAWSLLIACAPEVNGKTRLFAVKKQLHNAAASQAAINLYDRYCSSKQCLKCGIGVSVLK